MSRTKAVVLHLLISFLVVTTVLGIMYYLWYPNAYFTLMGGEKLIAILAGIDIFLGPLLTFCVFKAGKKGLKFDLFCIGLVQIAALSYGVYVMFQARPVFTVFNKTRFDIAAVVDIAPGELAKGREPQWQTLSITGPKLVAIFTPDKKNRKEHMFAMMETDTAYRYPRLYDDYNLHRKEVIKAGKPLVELSSLSMKNKLAVDKFVASGNRPEDDFLYLSISSELAEMAAIVDAKTGDLIKIIDAKPEVMPHNK